MQTLDMEAFYSLNSPSSCSHLYRLPSDSSSMSNATTTSSTGINHVIQQHYNHTGRLQNRTHFGTTTIIALIISILIILENLLVLVAVLTRICHSRRWVYVCIANITLSDLLTGTAYVVNICMSGRHTLRLSPQLWLFREGMLFVALAASIFSLLLIAVERYTTMMKPLHQKSASKSYYRIYGMVVLCWLLALVIGFLPLLGWNCMCNLESCSTLLPLYSKSYILFSVGIFLLILVAIGFLYGAIYSHVYSSADIIRSKRSRKNSLKLLRTVVTIVGIFVVCWAPLFFLLLLDFFCNSRQCGPLFRADWFIAMAVLNSALNPVIYALGSNELRKAIARLLCCCCLNIGMCDPDTFLSKDTNSTSENRRDSLRNSFNKVRSLSVVSAPLTPRKNNKAPRKYRLSTTTSCLSVSSG